MTSNTKGKRERWSAMTCQTTIRALLALILVPFAVCARADDDLLRAIKYGATAAALMKVPKTAFLSSRKVAPVPPPSRTSVAQS